VWAAARYRPAASQRNRLGKNATLLRKPAIRLPTINFLGAICSLRPYDPPARGAGRAENKKMTGRKILATGAARAPDWKRVP
jgi:hypothetical protein